jgi:hypothetical protein
MGETVRVDMVLHFAICLVERFGIDCETLRQMKQLEVVLHDCFTPERECDT